MKFVPKDPTNNIYTIGSDNGLAPPRRQANIWTNDGMFYWRIYASPGLNELSWFMCFKQYLLLFKLPKQVSFMLMFH